MGIISYLKRLKEYFIYRKEINKERDRNIYERSKKGIFSFFDFYKTQKGFYFKLRDKENLIDYIDKNKTNKTIENAVLDSPLLNLLSPNLSYTANPSLLTNSSSLSDSSPLSSKISKLQEIIERYNQPIYERFQRAIDYFKEIKDKLNNYSELVFDIDF